MDFFFDYFDVFVDWSNSGGLAFVWISISAILALTGVGLPTPEDIWLMLAGFMCSQSGFLGLAGSPEEVTLWHYVATLAFCACSNMVGDAACWWLGKRYGLSIRNKVGIFRSMLSDKRMAKAERWFARTGGATVFFGRLVAGVRFVVFFSAGMSRMKLSKFLIYDALGCCLSIPIWLYLGHLGQSVHGTDDYADFRLWAGETGIYVLIVGGVLVAGFLIWVKFFRKKDEEEEAPQELTGASGEEKQLATNTEDSQKSAPDE